MNSALERIEEADTEVVIVTLGDLGVGAGDADRGNSGFLEGIGCRYCNGRTVGAEDDGYALCNELGCCGNSLCRIRLVIGVNELYLIGLAADLDGGILSVCILHAEYLLLAACAVCAGLRLIHADLDDLLAAFAAVAACAQREHHEHRKNKC